MIKKFMVLIMSIVMMLSFTNIAYASDATALHADSYFEEITIRFDNNEFTKSALMKLENADGFRELNYMGQAAQQINAQQFNLDAETLECILDDLIPEEGDLLAITMKNTYCKEELINGNITSKLLTADEMAIIEENDSVKTIAADIGEDSESFQRLTFSVAVTSTNITNCEVGYLVATSAVWSVMGSNGYTYPAEGADAICLSWGGDLHKQSPYQSLTSFSGRSIPTTPVACDPDAGYGWEFEESGTSVGSSSSLNRAVCSIILTKQHALDELTELYAVYIHTYDDIDWNFSIGLGFGESIGGSVGIQPERATAVWSVILNIPHIPY